MVRAVPARAVPVRTYHPWVLTSTTWVRRMAPWPLGMAMGWLAGQVAAGAPAPGVPMAFSFTLVTMVVGPVHGVRAGNPSMSNPTAAQGRNPPSALHPPTASTHVCRGSSHMYGTFGAHATTPRSPHSTSASPPPHNDTSSLASPALFQHGISRWLIACHLPPSTDTPRAVAGAFVESTRPIYANFVGVLVGAMEPTAGVRVAGAATPWLGHTTPRGWLLNA